MNTPNNGKISISIPLNSSTRSNLSSPSPSPLTPNSQKFAIMNLCYAPTCKPLKKPENNLKKIRL